MPFVVGQAVRRLVINGHRPRPRLIGELQHVAVHDRQLDEIGRSRRVQYHRVVVRGAELEVDVAAVAHVELGQVDGRVGHPEGDAVVEQVVALADQRPEGVSALFFVQGVAGVAEAELLDRQVLSFGYVAGVFGPDFVAGVAVAPLRVVDAGAQDAALAFARACNSKFNMIAPGSVCHYY